MPVARALFASRSLLRFSPASRGNTLQGLFRWGGHHAPSNAAARRSRGTRIFQRTMDLARLFSAPRPIARAWTSIAAGRQASHRKHPGDCSRFRANNRVHPPRASSSAPPRKVRPVVRVDYCTIEAAGPVEHCDLTLRHEARFRQLRVTSFDATRTHSSLRS